MSNSHQVEASSLSVTNVLQSWCKCKPAQPYQPVGRRIFMVEDRSNVRFMLEVLSYCINCKGMLSPMGQKIRVLDSDGEDALIKARANFISDEEFAVVQIQKLKGFRQVTKAIAYQYYSVGT